MNAEHPAASCRAVLGYEWTGGGTERTVRCELPSGHEGPHERHEQPAATSVGSSPGSLNEPAASVEASSAATLREKAETLAGLMSVGSLGADESEVGANVIYDLLAENRRFAEEIERRATENARLQDGVSGLITAIFRVYEQAQTAMRKPSP